MKHAITFFCMTFLTAMTFVGAIAAAAAAAPASSPAVAQASGDRLGWFKEARFGMFIHWGIYAVPAGEWEGKTNYAEWFQQQTSMPAAQYAKFATQFNPVKFDAHQWARTAKNAGMKYLVITAKHHDGFSMFDSKLTDYDIVDATPYKRDPMKELAQACRDEGITFCFYYSIPDWHHPDFPAKYSQRGFHGAPNDNADMDKYVEYMKGQLRELLTNYGPIGILWFDGGGAFRSVPDQRAALVHAQELIDLIHELQPNCLVNNRLGLSADYGTPEQRIPKGKSSTPFEVCMTLNKHWGYNNADNNWKPAKEVIRNLADIASKGGNYLLNVGPTAEGVMPEPAVQILEEVGKWVAANGESIYGTSASPLDESPKWGRVTQKDKNLYLHVFDWPSDGKLALRSLNKEIAHAYLLGDADRRELKSSAASDTITVELPSNAPDANDSVVVLECK